MNVKFWVLYSLLNHEKHPDIKDHVLALFEPIEEAMDIVRKELGKIFDLPEKENETLLNESMTTSKCIEANKKTP